MPVDLATLGAFAVAAGAIAVSPGPDTMLILRYALTSGRAAGLAAVAGVQIGLVVHTALAAAGVSALIASSPALFKGLAITGSAYLAWLGLQGFHSQGALGIGYAARAGGGRACRAAILCNVLNPKVIVLFSRSTRIFSRSAGATWRRKWQPSRPSSSPSTSPGRSRSSAARNSRAAG
jgi:homoserine/homoserine lactone efflux protein